MRRVFRRFHFDPLVARRGDPNANPTSFRVLRDNSTVTRWAPLTNTKSLLNPNPSPLSAHSILAPPRARGPTTKFHGLVKSLSPPHPGVVEQSTTAPRGRSLTATRDVVGVAEYVVVSTDRSAVWALVEATTVAATTIANAVLAIAMPRRAIIDQRYTGGSAAVPDAPTSF